MTDIYLSHIRIQNFRTFGSFDVEIPAAPGLVILTGTNGLGKSSFFDAIEWGLTGFIRRFTPYVEKSRFSEGDYLTRRGAEANSHEVILTFSDGKPIVRSGSTTTPMASIVTQLAQSDRPAINDLGTYLALTHFLGQASQQRFTSRAPQDQWQALKGPSGMERLEQVRAGLRGRATTVAFTRRVDDEKSAVSEIERQIAEWQGWRARLDRLRQAARATGALATEEIAYRANLLEIELIPKLREPVVPISGETLSQHLARLGDRIAQAIHEATEREGLLKGLEGIVTQFAAASARARADHPVLVRAQEDFNNSLQALTESNSRAQAAEAALEAQNKVIGAIEQKIAILESARADLSQRSELAAQIDEAQAELSDLLVIIAEHRAALTVAEAVVRKHSDAESEVARLRNIAQRTRGCVESYSTLLSLEAAAATNANILEVAEQDASVAEKDLEPLVVENGLLNEQINRAVDALAEGERHADAVSAAVANIASHLHEHDTNCPVCRTSFEPGQLKLVASEAARSIDSRLAESASEIERLRSEAAIIEGQIYELQEIIGALPQLEYTLEDSREAALTLRSALTRELGIGADEDLGVVTKARDQYARAALAEAVSALEVLAAPGAESAAQRITIAAELEERRDQVNLVSSRLSSLRSADQDCLERITARGMAGASIESLNANLSTQRKSLEAARSQSALLADSASTMKSQLSNLRDALASNERTLSEINSARVEAEATAAQLADRWSEAGVEGIPRQVILDRYVSARREDLITLRMLSDRLQELGQENQDVLLQGEINEVIEAMRAAGGERGLANSETYLEELRGKEAEARAALKLTTEARKAVVSFTEQLKTRAENYSAQVLAPLNGVIDDFNGAMLSTPGESIQFRADHRVDATSFGMSLRSRQQPVTLLANQKDLPPQVVLSEGQLAANGFSILCAASIAYPWSRWRALLLDDPLQHNDIIHTAAFIDVMRNMVELQGYQLIISSHDRGESDFIARKFDAAGLACSRIDLTAPSDKGVIYEGPEHNQAAKRAMQKLNGSAQITA